MLIHASRHGELLPNREPRKRRKQRVEFARRSAVAVDGLVRLLEHERSAEEQRVQLPEAPSQKAGEDEHALAVNRPGHLDLAGDVDRAFDAGVDDRCHATWAPERLGAIGQHRDRVDLTDLLAGHVDTNDALCEELVNLITKVTASSSRGVEGLAHGGSVNRRQSTLRRSIAGLGRNFGDRSELSRHLRLAFGEPSGLKEQRRHRVGSQRRQPARTA